jgi:hypothetical protein
VAFMRRRAGSPPISRWGTIVRLVALSALGVLVVTPNEQAELGPRLLVEPSECGTLRLRARTCYNVRPSIIGWYLRTWFKRASLRLAHIRRQANT